MRAVVMFALVVCGGCGALQNGAASVLKPSQVSPSFKDLDDENPFAKPPNRVDVLRVGIANYDSFFADSAKVKGTVVLSDVVLKETDKFIADTKKRVGSGKGLSPGQTKAVAEQRARIGALTKLLGGVPDRSTKLVETSESLAKSAPKTFIGPNAVKLPGVVKGLQGSVRDLQDAAARAPKLLAHAGKTSSALDGLD